MMPIVVNNTELSGSNTMDGMVCMEQIMPSVNWLYTCLMNVWRMTNLKGNIVKRYLTGQEMKTSQTKLLPISSSRIIAMTYIKDVVGRIFAHDKPRTSTQSKSLTLPDSVKPMPFMVSHHTSCLQFYHITMASTKVTA